MNLFFNKIIYNVEKKVLVRFLRKVLWIKFSESTIKLIRRKNKLNLKLNNQPNIV